jgi:phosphatidylglycerol---prolipoprotein diacylglyceryl transferase
MHFSFAVFDPVAFKIGSFSIHWYGIAYFLGIFLAFLYAKRLGTLSPRYFNIKDVDDSLVWIVIGILIGGRLGYVLFYDFAYYKHHLAEIIIPFEGGNPFHGAFTGLRGMAFHGGLLGVMVAVIVYCRFRKMNILMFGDVACSVAPIGLFLGRIANFVNAELWGRPTDVSWAVVFPNDPLPRHPSQLYEAFLEGLLLLLLFGLMNKSVSIRRAKGFIAGTFFMGYGTFRFLVEFVREPDIQIGYYFKAFTQGQLLCLPMILGGAGLMIWAWKNRASL